jgi:hypothetical protein
MTPILCFLSPKKRLPMGKLDLERLIVELRTLLVAALVVEIAVVALLALLGL